MNRKTLLWLCVGCVLTLAASLALLHALIGQGAIAFSRPDHVAGPIILSVATLVGCLLLFVAIGVGMYVYRDARRRGMEPVLWTLLAIFIPYFIGLIVYLIVRQPLQTACLSCGARCPEKASFCPSCGQPLVRTCARCQASLDRGARFCHACGQEIAAV